MAENKVPNIIIEGATLAFRNFAGKPDRFNPSGNRNFCVLLEDDLADKLKLDGWNIKYLQPRDPEDKARPYLQVGVKFDFYPPSIYLIAGGKKTKLDEESVASLDYAEIDNVDIIIRPYEWEMGGKTGIKAYVKNLYVTIVEDEFASKYSDMNMSNDGDLPF